MNRGFGLEKKIVFDEILVGNISLSERERERERDRGERDREKRHSVDVENEEADRIVREEAIEVAVVWCGSPRESQQQALAYASRYS